MSAEKLAFNGTERAVEGAVNGLFVAVAEVTFWGYSFRTHTFQETEVLPAYQEAAAKIDCDLLVIDL